MNNLKNIIFDFGGVLLDIDPMRTYKAFERIIPAFINPNNLPENIEKILNDFETGIIGKASFLCNIQALGKNISHGDEIIDAWNAMLIGWNKSKFVLLEKLRTKYNIYLLSNTNVIHLEWVYADLASHHTITDFDSRYFDKTYYSHIIGMRKPNVEIYHYVTADAGLQPEETIFIDDTLKNIEGAQKVGWHTYHHNPSDDLELVLRDKLLLRF